MKFRGLSVILVLICWSISSVCLGNAQSSDSPANIIQTKDLFLTARSYHDGQGVEQDFQTARELYLAAASNGDTRAMLNLGYMEFLGQGQAAANHFKARGWYEFAADLGDEDAQKNIDMMNANALGLPAIRPELSLETSALDLEKREISIIPVASQARDIPSKQASVQAPAEDSFTSAEEAQMISKINDPIGFNDELIASSRPLPPAVRAGILMLIFMLVLGGLAKLVVFMRVKDSKERFVRHFYAENEADILVLWYRYKNPKRLDLITKRSWQNMIAALIAKFALKGSLTPEQSLYAEKIKREVSTTKTSAQMRLLSLALVGDVNKLLVNRSTSAAE